MGLTEEGKTVLREPFWSIHPRDRLKFSRRFVLFFTEFSIIFVVWHVFAGKVELEPWLWPRVMHLAKLWATNAWSIAVFTFLIAFVRQEMEAYMGYAQMRMRELDEKIAAHQKESDQVFIDKIKSAYPELDQSHLEEIIERSRKRPRPSLWSRLKRIVFDV